jgi:hypothetical protein
MYDIMDFYQGKLRDVHPNEYTEDQKRILKIKNLRNFVKPPHGLGKHIFARKDTPQYPYSVGAMIASELKKGNGFEPDIDLSDFLYKKCIDYTKKKTEIEIYNVFYEMFGYGSIEEYCKKKKLTNSVRNQITLKKTAKSIDKESKNKLEENLTGRWAVYSYNNEDNNKDSTLAVGLLEVVSLYNLRFFNAASDSSINYIGQLDNDMSKIGGVVYLKFYPEDKKKESRNLRMAFHISEDVTFDMAIGQYTNVDRGANLIRGSVCMYKIDNFDTGTSEEKLEELKARVREDDEEDIDENEVNEYKQKLKNINKNFKEFLNDKNLNFNRLPKNQYNSESFGRWLDVQEAKRRFLKKKNAMENKKLFISCPIHSVTKQQFVELKKVVEKIKQFFIDNKFSEVFSFIEEFDDQQTTARTPSTLEYQQIRKEFKKCNYHLAIWPKDLKPSGIMFEIGWAAMDDRPVVIFEQVAEITDKHTKSQIPHLLLGACDNKSTEIVRYPFIEFKEIFDILETNKLNIFPNQIHMP